MIMSWHDAFGAQGFGLSKPYSPEPLHLVHTWNSRAMSVSMPSLPPAPLTPHIHIMTPPSTTHLEL
jgi:hypothetical protein